MGNFMKKSYHSMAGITLLELMLVLAIAGVVIAMSIKYYQQAATNQRIAAGMGVVSSVVAAVESYRLTNAPIVGMVNDSVKPFFPKQEIPISPWDNKVVTIKGGTSGNLYTIDISTTDAGACKVFAEQIEGQQGFGAKCLDKVVTVTVGEAGTAP